MNISAKLGTGVSVSLFAFGAATGWWGRDLELPGQDSNLGKDSGAIRETYKGQGGPVLGRQAQISDFMRQQLSHGIGEVYGTAAEKTKK